MICRHCGKESPPSARFCAYCGSMPDAAAAPPPPRPPRSPRRRLQLLVALALLLAFGGLLAARQLRFGARLHTEEATSPLAGMVTPGRVSGPSPTLPPSGIYHAEGTEGAAGPRVDAASPAAAPAPRVTEALPGNLPAESPVTAAPPGDAAAGGPVTATPPGAFPEGNRVTAADAGNLGAGAPVTETPPAGHPEAAPVTAAPPAAPSDPPVTTTPPGNAVAAAPVTETPAAAPPPPPARPSRPPETDLVREYLRRLAVIQTRDNQLNEAIGQVAGGSLFPWAQGLDAMGDGDFFGQYARILQSYSRIAAAKESLANDFVRSCEPIARVCAPVQTLHRWYVRYFEEWIRVTRTLEAALRQQDLGLALQLQGLVQRAQNTERQAQREEDRLRDRYDLPPDPAGPR
ncbi:MAG: zinc ribbon domain-containing protein [Armatimonadetes bacterium]|jgi:hypothetical protein|nr:zinc ribbon domain-containing protein [Armatimonadota bacterium]